MIRDNMRSGTPSTLSGTPSEMYIQYEDSTSSCQSEHSSAMRNGGSNKKRTQETMKNFPKAIPTQQEKKKTNWTYNNKHNQHGNQKRQGSGGGFHKIVEGPLDKKFYLLEQKQLGLTVELMTKSKWHLILKIDPTDKYTAQLAKDNKIRYLICRLKLKANYKVLKDTRTNRFEDVNAEDCRMNLNPEGCFLVEESEWLRRKEDPSELKELAKFQDKRNCKDYKECKNSVVRAGQKIDKYLRERYFERYMDILYHKAFDAKLNTIQKKFCDFSIDHRRKVIEEMGEKPKNWQSKRSTEPAPRKPMPEYSPYQSPPQSYYNMFHKFHNGTAASSVASVDPFSLPPTPQHHPVNLQSDSAPSEIFPHDSVSQVNMPRVPYHTATESDRIPTACPGLATGRRQSVDCTPEDEVARPTNFIPPENHPSMPLPPVHPVYPPHSPTYAYPPSSAPPMPLPPHHHPAFAYPPVPYYPPQGPYGYAYPPYGPPMHMPQVPPMAPGYPYPGYSFPYPAAPCAAQP